MENSKDSIQKAEPRSLCRYYTATDDGRVVSWYPFIAGERELIIPTKIEHELVLNICKMFGVECDNIPPDAYNKEPYWIIENGKLSTYKTWLANRDSNYYYGDSWTIEEYTNKYTVGKLITVSQEKWDSICEDYKGIWQDYYDECPEWKGRRVVMSGCITEDPAELGKLLVEGVHFEISGRSDGE